MQQRDARFVESELIGAGNYGEVWRAVDTKLGRTVAIKYIPQALGSRRTDALAHARALAPLTHPNVVVVYEVVEGLAQPETDALCDAVVMEYVNAPTLTDRLKNSALTVAGGRALCEGILSALAYMHERGVAHGDLHSDNVLVTEEGAKLIDLLAGSFAGSSANLQWRMERDRSDCARLIAAVLRSLGASPDAFMTAAANQTLAAQQHALQDALSSPGQLLGPKNALDETRPRSWLLPIRGFAAPFAPGGVVGRIERGDEVLEAVWKPPTPTYAVLRIAPRDAKAMTPLEAREALSCGNRLWPFGSEEHYADVARSTRGLAVVERRPAGFLGSTVYSRSLALLDTGECALTGLSGCLMAERSARLISGARIETDFRKYLMQYMSFVTHAFEHWFPVVCTLALCNIAGTKMIVNHSERTPEAAENNVVCQFGAKSFHEPWKGPFEECLDRFWAAFELRRTPLKR